ncbi:MAG: hypothetical protein ACYTEU_14800 [Planctomycetota bacterium]
MMKKVTMLVMAMALVVPVLGYFEDNPPAWDAGENTATATWDFSTMDGAYADEMPPTCLEGTSAYMTCFAPENHDGDIGELLVGDSIGASIWYNVGVPDVEGAYITIRTQLFLAEGSDIRGPV